MKKLNKKEKINKMSVDRMGVNILGAIKYGFLIILEYICMYIRWTNK